MKWKEVRELYPNQFELKKQSKRIYNVIDEVCSRIITGDKLETATEMIILTAADVTKKVKGKYYPI